MESVSLQISQRRSFQKTARNKVAKAAKKSRGSFVDEKYLGPEPDLSSRIPTTTELILAYNWYNYFYSNDNAKEFVLDYFRKHHKKDKDLIRGINNCPSYNLRNLGWSCRIIDSGGNLPSNINIEQAARAIIARSVATGIYAESRGDDVENSSTREEDGNDETRQKSEVITQAQEKVSIQDRIKNKASDLISELEDEIDKFTINGESKFKIADWLRQKDVKPQIALRIADFYKPLYSEIFDAFEGKDDELKKAYAQYKKPQLRGYMEFVRDIVSACEARAEIVKAIRKPRKKKDKPASQIISKLKYKQKDDDFDIQSVSATEIIKSNQLWVFNCKYRTLSVYNAMGPAGLNVKGTTLIGFDEKTSITKTLRKPKEQLAELKTAGKITLRKIMDNIKSKAKQANGRINTETVLVKVIK